MTKVQHNTNRNAVICTRIGDGSVGWSIFLWIMKPSTILVFLKNIWFLDISSPSQLFTMSWEGSFSLTSFFSSSSFSSETRPNHTLVSSGASKGSSQMIYKMPISRLRLHFLEVNLWLWSRYVNTCEALDLN